MILFFTSNLTIQAQTIVDPTLTLSAAGIADQDDMCIWLHQDDKSLSTVITSDKGANKLFVYDLSGNAIQTLNLPGMPGNIDVRYNFILSGVPTDIVGYNDRTNGTIVFYKVDRNTRQLSFVSNFSDGGMTGNNYGFCLYHSLMTDKYYAIGSSQSTQMKQWELIDNGDGTITSLLKRTWNNGTGDITEGLVADDELGFLYAANEGEGIYKYDAEPVDPNPMGELIAPTGVNRLTPDVEGLTIYYLSGGNGYLIASSQGSDDFKVYERQSPHNFVSTVQVNEVGDTDGIDVMNLRLDSTFTSGIFLMHDGTGSPYVVRGCKWEDLGLEIDTTYWNPANLPDSPNNLTATATGINEVTLNWTDNSNNENGFIIERENASLLLFSIIDTVDTDVISYLDTTVSQGTRYRYRVSAFNNSGHSGYSNLAYVTTILPAPTNLVGQILGGPPQSIELNWEDNSNNELGFVVERDLQGSGIFETLDSVVINVTTYEDTNFVNPADSFAYRVYAFSMDTVSDYSNILEIIIPVELVSFTANVVGNSVIIKWTTATETNNKGFELERKLSESWEVLAFIEGKGSSVESSNYLYDDNFQFHSFSGVVLYRLKQIDFSGRHEYLRPIEVNVDFIPDEFILYQNHPNPFNPVTTIKFSQPNQTKVRLEILNILGEQIELLINEVKSPGTYDVSWNAGNLSSGIYLYKLQADLFTETKKMILLK